MLLIYECRRLISSAPRRSLVSSWTRDGATFLAPTVPRSSNALSRASRLSHVWIVIILMLLVFWRLMYVQFVHTVFTFIGVCVHTHSQLWVLIRVNWLLGIGWRCPLQMKLLKASLFVLMWLWQNCIIWEPMKLAIFWYVFTLPVMHLRLEILLMRLPSTVASSCWWWCEPVGHSGTSICCRHGG